MTQGKPLNQHSIHLELKNLTAKCELFHNEYGAHAKANTYYI